MQRRILLAAAALLPSLATAQTPPTPPDWPARELPTALLTVPPGAAVMPPCRIAAPAGDAVAVVTQQGRLLVFPAADIPVLNKGKGNKLIQIAAEDLAQGADRVIALTGLPPGSGLRLVCGKRHLTLTAADLQVYHGVRGRRGNHLPRGFQRVERAEAV